MIITKQQLTVWNDVIETMRLCLEADKLGLVRVELLGDTERIVVAGADNSGTITGQISQTAYTAHGEFTCYDRRGNEEMVIHVSGKITWNIEEGKYDLKNVRTRKFEIL